MLGDIAYENGTADDFANCFDPSWGLARAPDPGRAREPRVQQWYGQPSRSTASGCPPNGWYSYSLGAWHVIVLNSNCSKVGGCERGSPQWRWLQADLAAHRNRCTLAYWHHPRFSSGFHGSSVELAPFWDLLARAKADVVLQGHDHHYERFAPLKGIRSFVVGTGGKSLYPTLLPRPGSVVRNASTYGVLQAHASPDGLRLEVPARRRAAVHRRRHGALPLMRSSHGAGSEAPSGDERLLHDTEHLRTAALLDGSEPRELEPAELDPSLRAQR